MAATMATVQIAFIHSSIHLPYRLITNSGSRGAGAYPSLLWEEGRETPWTGRQSNSGKYCLPSILEEKNNQYGLTKHAVLNFYSAGCCCFLFFLIFYCEAEESAILAVRNSRDINVKYRP